MANDSVSASGNPTSRVYLDTLGRRSLEDRASHTAGIATGEADPGLVGTLPPDQQQPIGDHSSRLLAGFSSWLDESNR